MWGHCGDLNINIKHSGMANSAYPDRLGLRCLCDTSAQYGGHFGDVINRYNIFICNMDDMANSADPYQIWVGTVCAYTSALICGPLRWCKL